MLIGKQISGLCLLFSSKRVCCHCGVRHNHNINLCETELECANRLRAIGILLSFEHCFADLVYLSAFLRKNSVMTFLLCCRIKHCPLPVGLISVPFRSRSTSYAIPELLA